MGENKFNVIDSFDCGDLIINYSEMGLDIYHKTSGEKLCFLTSLGTTGLYDFLNKNLSK